MAGLTVRTISDQIAEQVRQAVLAGEFEPGRPLREDELAQRYGVSRHPIRKVLQQLTLEGLLVAKPNCGVTVAAESHEHVPTLLTPMRMQLEIYALRQAGSQRLQSARAEWERIIRQMARAAADKDEQAVLSLDAEFHLLLLRAAELDDFVLLWQAIYGRMRGHHRQSNRTLDDLGVVAFVHERLLESLLSDDLEQAVRDLQSHLENGEFNRSAKAAWKRRQRQGSKR
jgi:DNA-binding GntR family transcriptional regulator